MTGPPPSAPPEKAEKPCPFCKDPVYSADDHDHPGTTIPLDTKIPVYVLSTDGTQCRLVPRSFADHRVSCRVLAGDQTKRQNLEFSEQLEAAKALIDDMRGSSVEAPSSPECICSHLEIQHPDWGDSDRPCVAADCGCTAWRPKA